MASWYSLPVVQDFRDRYVDSELASIRRELQAFKELVGSNRASDKEAIALALTAAEKAVNKAEEANEKRLEGLNEIRGIVTDRIASIEGRFQVIITLSAIVGIGVAVYGLFR